MRPCTLLELVLPSLSCLAYKLLNLIILLSIFKNILVENMCFIFILLFTFAGSNDYVNNFLQPFLADGLQYTHDEFVELLISTLNQQLSVNIYKFTLLLLHLLQLI